MMEVQLNVSAIILLLSSALGLIIGVIMWIFPRNIKTPNYIYGTSLIILSLGLTIAFLISSHLILFVPHLYRLGNFFALLFMPLAWLYVRVMIKNQPLQWLDLLHLIPAILYLVDYGPFFLQGAEAKRIIIEEDLQDLSELLGYSQGWIFPTYFHLPLREITFFAYWFAQVRLIWLARRKTFVTGHAGKHWFQWIQAVLLIQVFLFAPYFLSKIPGIPEQDWMTTSTTAAISMLTTALFLLFRPDILYGLGESGEKRESEQSQTVGKPVYASLEHLDSRRLMEEMERFMVDEEPYLQSGFSVQDLALEFGLSYQQVSAVINQQARKNFSDYINNYRIKYCIANIDVGHWKKLTLEGISAECGFSNRNTFTKAFKKVIGQTPSSYLKERTL